MKRKQKIDFIISTFLMLIGLGLIISPLFDFVNVKLIFSFVMISYALLNLVQFLLTLDDKDYEGLLTFIACAAVGICNYIYYEEAYPVILSMSVILWITMMSIIRLIKADYYHDRKDRMWKLMIFTLVMFIIVGLITAVSFNYSDITITIVLGYFFLFHGFLEMIDPMVKYLITPNTKVFKKAGPPVTKIKNR